MCDLEGRSNNGGVEKEGWHERGRNLCSIVLTGSRHMLKPTIELARGPGQVTGG